MDFLEVVIFENTARDWLLSLLVAIAVFVVLKLSKSFLVGQLSRLANRTSTHLDIAVVAALRSTRAWFFVLAAIGAAAQLLVLQPKLETIIGHVVMLGFLLQLALWAGTAIRAYVQAYSAARIDVDGSSITTIRALAFVLNLVVWSILFLMALDNVGINITALVAGLGIGGIAVALAVQNILGDLFASLSIVLDKPFVYGDFIIVDDLLGTVEHIGIKTTRLRSLSGEQLVFSNSDLLSSRIRNFKRMYERRVVFKVRVSYQTPREKLVSIPQTIQNAIESLPDTRFDRSHFMEFGDFSLNFETVYYVLSPDFNVYMDRQQAINLEIHRFFEENEIEFAIPTQNVFVQDAAATA